MSDFNLLRALTSDSPSALTELAASLEDSYERGDRHRLDFTEPPESPHRSASALRLDTTTVLVLSNLLVGRYRDLPVEIRLPANRGLNLQLARGGIFFALSNRPEVRWVDGTPSEWRRLADEWHQPFHPDDIGMFKQALSTDRDLTRDDWVVRAAFQRYLLSVIGIHFRPPAAIRTELDRVAGRWLSSRLKVRHRSDLVATLLDCSEIFYEIQVNIADHARIGMADSGAALGQMFATLGGGRDSHNRLYLTSLDNGVGIPTTVRSRYQDRDRSDEEALADAVSGRLPGHGAGRGVGLSRVRGIADKYRTGLRAIGGASTIRIFTGDSSGSCIALDWRSGSDEPVVSTTTNLPVKGTIVVVCLGLERRTEPRDLADQLELTFDEAPVAP